MPFVDDRHELCCCEVYLGDVWFIVFQEGG